METTCRIELRDVSKNFGEVQSLRNVDFKLGQMRLLACWVTMGPVNQL
jgi:ABC-type sugar transport system ATPase subunit